MNDVSFIGINYTFPNNTFIPPGDYLVIANNFDAFITYFGFAPDGAWDSSGSLSNVGENLRMVDLFGNIIDQVNYSAGAPWDSGASNANTSLGLRLGGLDNSLPASWSTQFTNFTPGEVNVFDSDGDGVEDSVDQCPNFNDNLIGTTCNDNDACTTGETYDLSLIHI